MQTDNDDMKKWSGEWRFTHTHTKKKKSEHFGMIYSFCMSSS